MTRRANPLEAHARQLAAAGLDPDARVANPIYTWTLSDFAKEMYGSCKDALGFEWEREIATLLIGRVPLKIVVAVLRQAHKAYNDGAGNAALD